MNVLILGSGGREHALLWRVAQDECSEKIFMWPGNPGMELLPTRIQQKLQFISGEINLVSLKETIERHEIKLVIPGAENFIYSGVADSCLKWGVACFAPTTHAARLEKSKLFSKEVMTKASIQTAKYKDLTEFFETEKNFLHLLSEFERPVIKISGPSLGKGVFVCDSAEEANEILLQIQSKPMAGLEEGIFVEEGLVGKEVSFFYACNGLEHQYLGSAQDHKRLLDGDHGPNTGGMGAFSPVPWVDPKFISEITSDFLVPTLKTMHEIGKPFKGVLFLGLMVTSSGTYLLEYNVRFGDPETQVLLPLVEGDFTDFLLQVSLGKKPNKPIKLKNIFATHVVKAARGYPGNFGAEIDKGQRVDLSHLIRDQHSQVFFAGVKKDELGFVTSGGRVLGMTYWASTLEESRTKVYEKLSTVTFDGEQMRTDIGKNK